MCLSYRLDSEFPKVRDHVWSLRCPQHLTLSQLLKSQVLSNVPGILLSHLLSAVTSHRPCTISSTSLAFQSAAPAQALPPSPEMGIYSLLDTLTGASQRQLKHHLLETESSNIILNLVLHCSPSQQQHHNTHCTMLPPATVAPQGLDPVSKIPVIFPLHVHPTALPPPPNPGLPPLTSYPRPLSTRPSSVTESTAQSPWVHHLHLQAHTSSTSALQTPALPRALHSLGASWEHVPLSESVLLL